MSSSADRIVSLELYIQQLEGELARVAVDRDQARMQVAASGMVERAALALWGRAAADLLLLSDGERRMPEEYIAEIAARCWYAAEIFDRVAALPHGPQKKGGG